MGASCIHIESGGGKNGIRALIVSRVRMFWFVIRTFGGSLKRPLRILGKRPKFSHHQKGSAREREVLLLGTDIGGRPVRVRN